ncbi:MAG: hypothetical protein DHS20C15_05990 [Planctomycetota bacterium]|nr:MAG: hypothetical protein DHS20C15_05990 [Planctomycetota bacterium]
MLRTTFVTLCAALLCAPSFGQTTPRFEGVRVLQLSPEERAALDRERAQDNALGTAALPEATLDSPRDSILFADRLPFTPDSPVHASAAGATPTLNTVLMPAGPGGTGTAKTELFHYQIPSSYDPEGAPVPLVMGYHGFGASANSVLVQSQLEEECEARGWLFVTPTGYDDKLFASLISQQHVEAVFDWMIDQHNIDEERIYMVGFSMGGGYVTNFAARHRDPEGLMIAAVGTVSAALDWTLLYATSGQTVKLLMNLPENFGGSPTQNSFGYLQSSGLHYMPMSYPPLPGDIFELYSMARNNTHLPVYQTYDSGDTLPLIVPENEDLFPLLNAQAPMVVQTVVSGTVDGEGLPAEHSWNVLDEVALFDFFAPHSAERFPQDFHAMIDTNTDVSWLSVVRRGPNKFVHVVAEADELARTLSLDQLYGAAEVTIDAGHAGLSGSDPIRVDLSVGDVGAQRFILRGFDTRPSYLLDAVSAELIEDVASNPLDDSLVLTITGPVDLSFDVIQDPDWVDTLTSSPNPVQIDNVATVDIDGPETATSIFLIIAFEEQLYSAKGVKLGALAVPPATIKLFSNPGPGGDLSLPAAIPNDVNLQGLRLPLQSGSLGAGGEVLGVSNLWGVLIK